MLCAAAVAGRHDIIAQRRRVARGRGAEHGHGNARARELLQLLSNAFHGDRPEKWRQLMVATADCGRALSACPACRSVGMQVVRTWPT